MQESSVQAQESGWPGKVTRIIQIGRDARYYEHCRSIGRQVLLRGARNHERCQGMGDGFHVVSGTNYISFAPGAMSDTASGTIRKISGKVPIASPSTCA